MRANALRQTSPAKLVPVELGSLDTSSSPTTGLHISGEPYTLPLLAILFTLIMPVEGLQEKARSISGSATHEEKERIFLWTHVLQEMFAGDILRQVVPKQFDVERGKDGDKRDSGTLVCEIIVTSGAYICAYYTLMTSNDLQKWRMDTISCTVAAVHI